MAYRRDTEKPGKPANIGAAPQTTKTGSMHAKTRYDTILYLHHNALEILQFFGVLNFQETTETGVGHNMFAERVISSSQFI